MQHHTWEGNKGVQVLVKNPYEKRPFGIPGHRWEDYIKVDHTEIEREDVD
jgi:hypothetical protein